MDKKVEIGDKNVVITTTRGNFVTTETIKIEAYAKRLATQKENILRAKALREANEQKQLNAIEVELAKLK